jgi:hypothetical protein
LFALCANGTIAPQVGAAMADAVRATIGGDPQTYISSIDARGARVVSTCAS